VDGISAVGESSAKVTAMIDDTHRAVEREILAVGDS
jgi:hypothetical protein